MKNANSDTTYFYLQEAGSTNISVNGSIFKVTLKGGSQVMCCKGSDGLSEREMWTSVNYDEGYYSTSVEPRKLENLLLRIRIPI